ncbi:MAG: hypothetical protein WCT44_02895 [Candidatus Paceibacterota bacterium]
MDKVKPPKSLQNLRNNIISGIILEEYRRAKLYFFFFITTLFASVAGVAFSLKYLAESFYQSGFYEYISLMFSGDNVVFSYWKELSLSLVDSIPILGVIVFLSTLGILVWSGANALSNTRRFLLQTN